MNIFFEEEEHIYYPEGKKDQKLLSVSGLFDLVKPKFDSIGISEKYSAKGKEKILQDLATKWEISLEQAQEKWGHLEMTPQDIRNIWEEKKKIGLARGTKWHKDIEEHLLSRGGKRGTINHGTHTQALPIKDLTPGEYIELIIPYPRLGLIGTADRVEILPNKEFFIRDWKGFPLDTEIPCEKGFTLMQDIKVGDKVFDGDGNLTIVKNISEIHYNPCYKITFDTNESIVCDNEHRWEIYTGTGKSKYQNKKSIWTTEDIFKYYQNNVQKIRIKNSTIQTKEIELPIDPYVLGCWLGDGNSYFGRITNMNPKLWEEIKKRGYELGKDVSNKQSKAEDKTIFGLSKSLQRLNLLQNKHIPDIYLRGSFSQRLDVLRGFMDTDGHFNRKRKRNVMETTKEWQADAIQNLVSSLGYKATKFNIKKSGFNKKNIPAFQVWFTMDISPYLSKNEDYEVIMEEVKFFNSQYRYIKSIEKTDMIPTKCIEVESSLHTYLITRNYLKTHNSDSKLEYQGKAFYNPEKGIKEVRKLLPPLDHLDDVNGIHYDIKESLYIYFLESYGFKFKEGWIDHVQFLDNEPIGVVEYPITYRKQEIINLLNWYKLNYKK